jgi:hypothetical protein
MNYNLFSENVPGPNRPVQTGIVQQGGIPFMDQQLRPEVYAAGGPEEVNAAAAVEMEQRGISSEFFDGEIGAVIVSAQQQAAEAPIQALSLEEGEGTEPGDEAGETAPEGDLGIVPTATPSG